jgi:flavin-dependent trigonelline monooxygenase, reductase component
MFFSMGHSYPCGAVMTYPWIRVDDCDSRALREMLGSFMTGVTVVATRLPDGNARAFTANSFTSVSLEPPLVLVCLAKGSWSLDVFVNSQLFSINVLSEEQRETSNAFASRDPVLKAQAIAELAGDETAYIAGSLTTIICERHDVLDGGDHVILLGLVREFQTNMGQPLGFFRGRYVSIGPSIQELEQADASLIVGGILEYEGKLALCRKSGSPAWAIPSASMAPGERHGAVLSRLFANLGVSAEARHPYSLFQEVNERNTTLIFSVETSAEVVPGMRQNGSELGLFGPEDKPWELINGEMKQGVLQRYFQERDEGHFGIYFDTTSGGRVVSLGGEKQSKR